MVEFRLPGVPSLSPLGVKRSPPPKRRTRLAGRSERGQSYQDEYLAMIPLVRARSRGRCEIRSSHDCDGFAQEYPHHRKLRKQGGSNSLDNLLDVCFTGHNWLHRDLPRAEANRLGLLIPRDTPEYPYDPKVLP